MGVDLIDMTEIGGVIYEISTWRGKVEIVLRMPAYEKPGVFKVLCTIRLCLQLRIVGHHSTPGIFGLLLPQ